MIRATAAILLAALLSSCTALKTPEPDEVAGYVLDAVPATGARAPSRDLVIGASVPRAHSGFQTTQMAYLREPNRLEYFTRSRWADPPANMLGSLIVRALERSGSFRAVVQLPSASAVDVRLDTELVRLQHDFSVQPSRVRLTLRAQLSEAGSRRVIATAEFEETENAGSDNAYGGVLAANRALVRLLGRVAVFCDESTAAMKRR